MSFGAPSIIATSPTIAAAGTTLAVTPLTAQLNKGSVGIIAIAFDNTNTTDGDFNEVSNVTDSAGNLWLKVKEWTNGEGAAAAGCTVAIWITHAQFDVVVGGTITVTFANSVFDRCFMVYASTMANGMEPHQASSAAPVTGTSDAIGNFASLTFTSVPSTSKARLYFRASAKEANSTATITSAGGFTALTGTRSRNNASAVIVRCEHKLASSATETSNPTMGVTGDTADILIGLEEVFCGFGAQNEESMLVRNKDRPGLLSVLPY